VAASGGGSGGGGGGEEAGAVGGAAAAHEGLLGDEVRLLLADDAAGCKAGNIQAGMSGFKAAGLLITDTAAECEADAKAGESGVQAQVVGPLLADDAAGRRAGAGRA
jgi:hypothetical protein